jgi:hypothetical protein
VIERDVDLGPWPSFRQELLLAAALSQGEPALAAWSRWVCDLDPERLEEQIEPDSQWLMPLLYWNLRRDVTHPVLTRCRNVYLHNWYRNNAMLHALAAAVRPGGSVAVKPILLKGAAMAVRYYDSPGTRPLATIDALLPSAAHGRARWPAPLRETLTLHDAAFPVGSADGLLDRAETVIIMGAACAVMGAADQLVHICLARRSWDPRTGLVWLADAAQVLRRSPGLDWGAVRASASRLGLTEALSAMLDFVGRFDVPVRRL